MFSALTVHAAELEGLQRRLSRLGGVLREELLDGVGALLESSARDRIGNTKTDPDGQPWDNWSPAYAADRPNGKGLLQDSNALLDSLSHETRPPSEVIIFAATVYAATHQFGRGAIPARAYLGISRDDERDIQSLLDDLIEDALA